MMKIFMSLICAFLLSGCLPFNEPAEENKIVEEFPDLEPEEETPVIKEEPHKSRVEEIMDNMTLEQKVGQMFIVRYSDEAAKFLNEYYYGGFIFFAKDFANETIESMNMKINMLQVNSPLNMFMGVDEEGGTVNRISWYPQYRAVPFHSPQSLYNEGGFDLVSSDTLEKCELLHRIGLNMNFAPVVDVPQSNRDYIFDRSFGTDYLLTSLYAETMLPVMKEKNIASVLKHFPGYGNNEDTHTGVAIDERSLENFYSRDFIPFSSGIQAGADMVLVTHTIVKNIDEFTPASLSYPVHELLRKELAFEGVIITDDLIMDGITALYTEEEAAVLAVLAGNDLLCSSNYSVQIPAVLNAVYEGRISEERINESVKRILECKLNLGIIE